MHKYVEELNKIWSKTSKYYWNHFNYWNPIKERI